MNLNQETKIKNVWYFKDNQPIVEAKRKGESQNFYGALDMKSGKCIAMAADKQNSHQPPASVHLKHQVVQPD